MQKIILSVVIFLLISASGCRNIIEDYSRCNRGDGEEIFITYNYSMESRTLRLEYRGMLLNCCFSEITAAHKVEGKKIFIKVNQRFRKHRCRCVCPHRVTMSIPGLSKDKYIIHMPGVKLRINLQKQISGKKVFRR